MSSLNITTTYWIVRWHIPLRPNLATGLTMLTEVKNHLCVHPVISLAHATPFYQVSWKSDRYFFRNPATKQINKPTNKQTKPKNITLAEVITTQQKEQLSHTVCNYIENPVGWFCLFSFLFSLFFLQIVFKKNVSTYRWQKRARAALVVIMLVHLCESETGWRKSTKKTKRQTTNGTLSYMQDELDELYFVHRPTQPQELWFQLERKICKNWSQIQRFLSFFWKYSFP